MTILQSLIELIQQYGFDTICCAVVVYFSISSYITNKNTKKQRIQDQQELHDAIINQNQQFMNQMRLQNEKLMDKLISIQKVEQKLQSDENETHHTENLKIRMAISSKVNTILNGLREKNNADRALVLEFHNSNQNLSGMPFAKFSCSYEDVKFGNVSIVSKLLNFPFSTISNIVKQMVEDNVAYLIYDNIDEDLQNSSVTYNMLKSIDVCSIIYVGLYDTHKSLMGLVALEYKNKDFLKTIDINDILKDVNTIQEFIDLKHPSV